MKATFATFAVLPRTLCVVLLLGGMSLGDTVAKPAAPAPAKPASSPAPAKSAATAPPKAEPANPAPRPEPKPETKPAAPAPAKPALATASAPAPANPAPRPEPKAAPKPESKPAPAPGKLAPAKPAPAPPPNPAPSPVAKVVSIQVEPATFTLQGRFASQALAVTGKMSDGLTVDLTGKAEYQSASAAIAEVGPDGAVAPRSDGETAIAVRVKSGDAVVAGRIAVTVKDSRRDAVDFANDLAPVLLKIGCSSTACHGSAAGRGNLKFSLFGGEPDWDYGVLTRSTSGRRIDRLQPHKSLLLAKATGSVAHGGGQRIVPGSPQHAMLVAWLAQGTPFADAKAPKLTGLRASPAAQTLGKGDSRRIQVTALYADGTQRDVTRLAVYKSSDASVVAVDPTGRIHADDFGQCAIVATYLRKPATVAVIVPQPSAGPFPAVEGNRKIDELVLARLKLLGIPPSDLSGDGEFLRRVYLDVIGILPTADEARTFPRDKYSIIRSFTHPHFGHETGTYTVMTGMMPTVEAVYPSMGSVVSLKKGSEGYKGLLPPYITLTGPLGRFSDAGFLGSKHRTFATGGDPNAKEFTVEGLVLPGGVNEKRLKDRHGLLQQVDTLAREMDKQPLFRSVDTFQQRAFGLVLGDAKNAFNMALEKDALRERYGRNQFGQSCLLARRLVEADVPFVTINMGGWDTHTDNFGVMKNLAPVLDKGLSALLEDLAQRGRLAGTIVVCYGEFGRTTKVEWAAPWNGGRHHWPSVYSCVVAGGGFRGGTIVGSSDAKGEYVKDRPVYPWDLAASIYRLLGIDPTSKLPHPQGCVAYVTPIATGSVPSGGMLTEIM